MAGTLTSIGTNSGSTGATLAIASTSAAVAAHGTILVCVAEDNTAGIGGSVADAVGNTYVPITGKALNNANTNGFVRAFVATDVIALPIHSAITYTRQTSGVNAVIDATQVTGFTGVATLDSAVTATASGTGTSISVTSGAPSVANELMVGIVGSQSTSFGQEASPLAWSAPPSDTNSTVSHLSGGNRINTGTSAMTYAPTQTSSVWAAIIIGFKGVVSNKGRFFGLF